MRRHAADAHRALEGRFTVEDGDWAEAFWKPDSGIQSTVKRSIPLIA